MLFDGCSTTAFGNPTPPPEHPGASDITDRLNVQHHGAALMLWTIAIILLALWAIGLVFKVAGALIHLLLVIALIVVIFKVFASRKNP